MIEQSLLNEWVQSISCLSKSHILCCCLTFTCVSKVVDSLVLGRGLAVSMFQPYVSDYGSAYVILTCWARAFTSRLRFVIRNIAATFIRLTVFPLIRYVPLNLNCKVKRWESCFSGGCLFFSWCYNTITTKKTQHHCDIKCRSYHPPLIDRQRDRCLLKRE